jgi:hypothetical protein
MESNFHEIRTTVVMCGQCGVNRTYVIAQHKERKEMLRSIARWCACPIEDLLAEDIMGFHIALSEVDAKAPKRGTV